MKYQLTVYTDRMVRETWEVEADSKDKVMEKLLEGEGNLLCERVTSSELVPDTEEIEVMLE